MHRGRLRLGSDMGARRQRSGFENASRDFEKADEVNMFGVKTVRQSITGLIFILSIYKTA